jgi:hypothetical protein
MVRCLLHQARLPIEFWGEAVATAAHLHNITAFPATSEKSAYEIWSGHKPDYNSIKIWGCVAFAHIPKHKRTKLDFKSKKCVFLGYELNRKSYRLLDLENDQVIICRDVIFHEDKSGGDVILNNDQNPQNQ